MNYVRMKEIQDEVFARVEEIRSTKGREYADDDDTLADFFEVAEEAGTTPLQTWLTYERKHSRAVGTFCREGDVKSESIRSRVEDVICYHLLLLGLVEDIQGRESAANTTVGVAVTDAKPGDRVKVVPGIERTL